MKIVDAFGRVEAARIPDFQTLATAMQECAKPIYAIDQDDTKEVNGGVAYSGAVWEDFVKRMREWEAVFAYLAERVKAARDYIVG